MIKKWLVLSLGSLISCTAVASLPCPAAYRDMSAYDFSINFNEARAKIHVSGTTWNVLIKSQIPLSTDMINDILEYNVSPVYGSDQNGDTVCTYKGMYPNTTFTATSSWW